MNLEKAIEIVDLKVKGCNPYLSGDLDDACRLLIEAGKIIEAYRLDNDLDPGQLLPGETKNEQPRVIKMSSPHIGRERRSK